MGDLKYRSYKDMLIQLSDMIDQRTLEALKFRCDGLIGSRERETIISPLQLWSALEKRECIGMTNVQFLKEILKSCMGRQLSAISLVEDYEQMSDVQHDQQRKEHNSNVLNLYTPILPPQVLNAKQETNVLQREFQYLSKSLGREWPFFIRELELPESEIDMIRMDHRFTRDQIYQCLLAWQDTNKQTATKQRLICALQEIERNDLVEIMESGDY